MEAVRRIVRNEYFPAAVVLAGVALFWAVALAGGLSMLNSRNLPVATLAWMLFVYLIAALSPVAATLAARDLIRRCRWNRRNRNASLAGRSVLPGAELSRKKSADGQKAA